MVFDRLRNMQQNVIKSLVRQQMKDPGMPGKSFVQATLREKIGLDKLLRTRELKAKITGTNQFERLSC
jgi:hypothetical protein